MRILFLLDDFSENGAGNALFRLCARMVAIRELTMSCISLGSDGPIGERLNSLGIHSRALGLRGIRDWGPLKEQGRKALYRSDRPDVVHSFCCWPDLAARFFHGGREDVPLVTSVLDMAFCGRPCHRDNLLWRAAERATRRHLGRVVVCCETARREIAARGIAPARIKAIPMGIDGVQCYPVSDATRERFRSLLSVADDAAVLLCPARLEHHHGVETVLDAMASVARTHPHARLFLVGDGPARDEFEQRIATHDLARNVTIIGHLSSVMARLYSTADIMIHTGPPEAFSIPAAECMAAGTPVVAASVGAIPDLVLDHRTGIVHRPGDSHALALAIKTLLDDPEMRQTMGTAAREHIIAHHEITHTADQYVRLWREVAPAALWETTTSLHFEDLHDIKREAMGG